MIYLFYGNKSFLIKDEIKKIMKNFDEVNISKYDLENDSINAVIDDSMTLSLFDDKKLVICENANMFTGNSSGASEVMLAYLNNPNPNTTLVLTVNHEKLDERKKITKLIKKIGEVKEFNQDINSFEAVKREFKDYNISASAINLLIDRVGKNPLILKQEIAKLKLYKDNNTITNEDILEVTHKKIDADIFKLIDYIVCNDKEHALELYYEMVKLNEEPIKVIIILANQFRLMYQSKNLLKRGLSEKAIAETLKVHPYRVKLALQNSRKYSSEMLLDYISDLADMDIDIKTGQIDKNLALKLFILKK